jgi:hypothetical protein
VAALGSPTVPNVYLPTPGAVTGGSGQIEHAVSYDDGSCRTRRLRPGRCSCPVGPRGRGAPDRRRRDRLARDHRPRADELRLPPGGAASGRWLRGIHRDPPVAQHL